MKLFIVTPKKRIRVCSNRTSVDIIEYHRLRRRLLCAYRDGREKAGLRAVKAACGGKLLKVIIETCLLSEDEKIRMCRIVTESGAEYIKTSTSFSTAGATREDIKLFAKYIGPNVRMKAAGGIASLEDAQDFLDLGASRLGTSRIVKAAKEQEHKG